MTEEEQDDCDYGDGTQDDPHRTTCWYCGGDGWGIVGTDWDCSDGVNGPYDGETERCPCCHGTGKAKDESFW